MKSYPFFSYFTFIFLIFSFPFLFSNFYSILTLFLTNSIFILSCRFPFCDVFFSFHVVNTEFKSCIPKSPFGKRQLWYLKPSSISPEMHKTLKSDLIGRQLELWVGTWCYPCFYPFFRLFHPFISCRFFSLPPNLP